MKKLLYSLSFIALTVAMTTSCNSFLDQSPSTELPTDGAIVNIGDAKTALNGVYDAFQGNNANTSYYGAQMIYRPDVCGDMMQPGGVGKRSSGNYEMDYTGPASPNIWNVPYDAIRRCNNLIVAIDAGKVADGAAEDVSNIKGQALTLRALAHFDLARNYGKPYTADNGASLGVPIVLTPLLPADKPARSTVVQVYTQVIADLTAAIPMLKTDKSTGYINQAAAKALLARVYLYQGENQKAFDLAVDVITTGGYRLWTNEEYATVWDSDGTAEVMFELVNFDSNDWVDREAIGYLMQEVGYGDIILSKKAVNYFNSHPTDVRGQLRIASTIKTNIDKFGAEKVWLMKYPGRKGFNDVRVNNVPLLRLSETYLIAAEAAVKLGNQVDADKYLNAIVKRAMPEAADVVATLTTVLDQRAIELVGEGHRFFDLMRNNLTSDRSGENRWNYLFPNPLSEKFTQDYFRIILAIPQSELNANINIRGQQNPGYAN